MNKELNICGILASFNITNKATLEAAGDMQTKIPSK